MSNTPDLIKCRICGLVETLPEDWNGNVNCPGCKSSNCRVVLSDKAIERCSVRAALWLIFAACAMFWTLAFFVIRALMSAGGAE